MRLLTLIIACATALSALAVPAMAAPKHGRHLSVARMAAVHPTRPVNAIVQLSPKARPSVIAGRVRALHGRVIGKLPIIHGIAVRMTAKSAHRLARVHGVRHVSLNATMKATATTVDSSALAMTFDKTVGVEGMWNGGATGEGVGVAVVDSGVAGDLPDFRVSQTDTRSRVVANVVTNPNATSAGDPYGHGTHVAGIIAGNGGNRDAGDPLAGRYVGTAPDANIVAVKAGDDDGHSTVLDVLTGLQFILSHKDEFNIRVVNLSLESGDAESYKVDPLDAGVEALWLNGIVVVAAAGNRGDAADAPMYAPANDPFVITVGATDEAGTPSVDDDFLATFSSRGITEDGFAKPDVLAPGAHMVSTLAPGSVFSTACPSCIVGGAYIRASGTSMAAPVVSGIVATLLQVHPDWTPNMVKGALKSTATPVAGSGAGEVNAVAASNASGDQWTANQGLVPNVDSGFVLNPVDLTQSSWSQSSWSQSSWSQSSWTGIPDPSEGAHAATLAPADATSGN